MDLSAWHLGALVGVAFVAGVVDAIAGGGGLLTVPLLLTTGLSSQCVLGTNKGQSVWGSCAALYQYRRAGAVRLRTAGWAFGGGALGALLGARLALLVDPHVLRPVVLCLLVAAAVLLTLRPMPRVILPLADETVRLRRSIFIALALGIYDGFFGPGTGTFLILASAYWLGLTAERATAGAKVVNVASNLAALSVFAWQGVVVWRLALPMAAAQLVGGTLGSRWAVRGGQAVIRPMLLLVVVGLVGKLAFDWLS